MTPIQRSQYVAYISTGVRFALAETQLKQLPDSTQVVVFNTWGGTLQNLNTIMGLNILVTEIPSAYEFSLAFNSSEKNDYKLLKAFLEFQDLYSITDFGEL